MESDILECIFDGSIKPRDVKLSALERITDNFSKERIIGEGGFATVYKGVLRNGEVAVKRIKNGHTIDEKLFRREVNSLLMVNHKNIVRFLAFCSHTENKPYQHEGSSEYILFEERERILCFEYINNGSLENYIADELRGLQWDTRYLIIKGICEGLQYLHTEKRIMHMDLKPANILIDDNMVAKITDFGLSRMVDNSQTKTKNLFFTPGYCAPEFIDSRTMSPSYDMYSLGVIIIQLVSGHRSIPESNNVLRRWSHRWHKSGKETPFRYQQIAKLIEIGLLCQEKDPKKRPLISDIISVLNELQSTDGQINHPNESTVGQINPYPEDDMLGIEPLVLRFPIELNTDISTSLQITNETNAYFAFFIQTTSPLPYCIQPNKHIVAPRSKYSVNITLQPLDHALQDWQCTGDFIVWSTKVNENLISEDITEDIFNREDGKLVDEVNLLITYKAKVPPVDISLGSLIITETRNPDSPQESNVPQTEKESKISGSTSDEVIQFDPPKLCFPLVPDKKVLSSIKIINMTEFYVSFHLSSANKNTAYYSQKDSDSVIPPRSTKPLTITREEKEDQVKDMSFNEEIYVWYAIVAEDDMEACDLDWKDYSEWKNLPIVLTNASSCTSNELIQFDPPALSLPFMPNKNLVFSVNIVNNTDLCVGFDVFQLGENVGWFYIKPPGGVIPPRSTQRLLVKRISEGKDNEDMQCKDKFLLWSRIVSEGVQASDFKHTVFMDYEGCKELPIVYKTTSLCTSDELIHFDPPHLSFPFLPNMRVSMVCFFKIINVTDHSVGFKIWSASHKDNSAVYKYEPHTGILSPQSTQAIKVRMTLKEQETEDMQCKDKTFVWNGIVTEGVDVSDVAKYKDDEDKELPIVLTKITSSSLVELIKFEPPEVCFPFLPSKRLLSSIKIVNITDFHIGFNTDVEKTNVALYITEPPCGVLPPWSTQELVVTRVAKEEAPELEDIQCKDKYFVWSCFVTEDVTASDLRSYMPETERKELPIVFTETSSSELIQFEPPELCFPLLPNLRALSSAKMVNITDQYIGFRICGTKSNSARYDANPLEGILPPLSTQVLLVTRVAQENELEDTQCKHKLLVWNGIVTEDVKASDVIAKMSDPKCTELPIVLTKTSLSISDELVQFHPLEHHFPFLANKKVLSTIKIVNLTDYNVGFNTYTRPTSAAWYYTEPPTGILQPRSTQKLMVTREEKEDALKDKQFNDKYFVWTSVVSEGVKYSDLTDYIADQESKEFPIVLDKISSLTSDELIQLDPPELCMPNWPNNQIKFIVNVLNTTDFYIAFNLYYITRNAARHKQSWETGILPPRSTKRCILHWITGGDEPGTDCFVWNRVVTEGVERGDIAGYMFEEESKKLHVIVNKVSPCPSNGLIHFDPPELSLPFVPNKPLVFSVNIVNNTDYCVGFAKYHPKTNVGVYYILPASGVMRPRSTQRLVVELIPGKDDQQGMHCKDKFFLWTCLVSEGAEANDIVNCTRHYEGSKELPFVYKKTSLCTSDELIQFDPPQLSFPFLQNKRVSMFCFFKIVNVTDHNVGINMWKNKSSSADYKSEPEAGILPPHSTQKIKVRRTRKKEEAEDMQCKDKIIVWMGIVTQGVEVSDLRTYSYKNKKLPVVLTKPGGSSSS